MSVALTYYLTTQCGSARPFCVSCVNSFTVNTCRTPCKNGPTTVCLQPANFDYIPTISPTCYSDKGAPYAFSVTVSGAAADLRCSDGTHLGDGNTLNGTYVLTMTSHTIDGGGTHDSFVWTGSFGDWSIEIRSFLNGENACEIDLVITSLKHTLCDGTDAQISLLTSISQSIYTSSVTVNTSSWGSGNCCVSDAPSSFPSFSVTIEPLIS